MQGKADCAELPGRLLEGSKTSKNRVFDLSTPKLPFASKGGGRIVSASRSPPGLCSNLRSSVRVPNEYTFRVTFRIIFGPFGIIFEACLGPWGHFGGAVGSLFASKISLGLQRWPKKRLPRNPLTLLETFWSSFFEYFRCFC